MKIDSLLFEASAASSSSFSLLPIFIEKKSDWRIAFMRNALQPPQFTCIIIISLNNNSNQMYIYIFFINYKFLFPLSHTCAHTHTPELPTQPIGFNWKKNNDLKPFQFSSISEVIIIIVSCRCLLLLYYFVFSTGTTHSRPIPFNPVRLVLF